MKNLSILTHAIAAALTSNSTVVVVEPEQEATTPFKPTLEIPEMKYYDVYTTGKQRRTQRRKQERKCKR